ncbi:hypothetical protein GDO86_001789 [Hymenochirus boettgeri]|uniref:Uncharacterized protein n=1 Tax=Hymenochirus boettgeri TaxID=247094 RepID=A0A8T2KHD5_9PIPI|nr:hypothetical protein GDO86_001789 [Hymenochirus boettgeri]
MQHSVMFELLCMLRSSSVWCYKGSELDLSLQQCLLFFGWYINKKKFTFNLTALLKGYELIFLEMANCTFFKKWGEGINKIRKYDFKTSVTRYGLLVGSNAIPIFTQI